MTRRKSMVAFRGLICMTDFLFTLSAGLLLLNYEGIVKPVATLASKADPEAQLRKIEQRVRAVENETEAMAKRMDEFSKRQQAKRTLPRSSATPRPPRNDKPPVR